jgi:hypothetical protein
MNEKNKRKLAYIYCAELFEFNVIPFELMNILAIFQRIIDKSWKIRLKVERNY